MKSGFIVLSALTLLTVGACTDYQEEFVLTNIISDTQYLYFGKQTEEKSFRIDCGDKWSVTEKPGWIKVTSICQSAPSLYKWQVTLLSVPNDGYDRTGILQIETERDHSVIYLSQEGKLGYFVPIESIAVHPESATIRINNLDPYLTYIYDYCTLRVEILPNNASSQSVVWTSDNKAVATVDSNGNVTPKSIGTATITAKSVNGEKKAHCVVNVVFYQP